MRLLLLFAICCALYPAIAQPRMSEESIQVLFWNVENLFDTEDDSLTNDDEYVPYSMRGWKRERYEQKLYNIYQILVAAGGWKLPDIIALAEVENLRVLEDLLDKTPLFRSGYRIIHQDSKDSRGIDLAIIYLPERISIVDTSFIQIRFPDAPHSRTRDILHAQVRLVSNENFHLFINHWPSRYGGGRSSEDRRVYVASVLKEKLEALYQEDSLTNCVIMGDFNDVPEDASLKELASARGNLKLITEKSFLGTHKHQGIWSHFDQIWVSNSLLLAEKLQVLHRKGEIFHQEWLLEEDKTFGGLKPRRTYVGYQYHGGYSDHLPIYLELMVSPQQLAEREK